MQASLWAARLRDVAHQGGISPLLSLRPLPPGFRSQACLIFQHTTLAMAVGQHSENDEPEFELWFIWEREQES